MQQKGAGPPVELKKLAAGSRPQGEAVVGFFETMAPMTDNSKRTGAAIEAHYQFLAWLVPTIEKFPKSRKFTIGDRIETIALDVLEALIEATYTSERTPGTDCCRMLQCMSRFVAHHVGYCART